MLKPTAGFNIADDWECCGHTSRQCSDGPDGCRHDWAVLDPQDEDDLLEGVPADIKRSQKRRNFLIEKARNASIIGVSRTFVTCWKIAVSVADFKIR